MVLRSIREWWWRRRTHFAWEGKWQIRKGFV